MSFKLGGIIQGFPRGGKVNYLLNSGEVIMTKKQCAGLRYSLNPERKCYHAKNTLKLKHFNRIKK